MSSIEDERVIFFVHVMKTGGTTALRHLLELYPDEVRYPVIGMYGAIAEKALVQSLEEVDAQRREGLRLVAPHMPLSVALKFREQSERPVAITLMLRDGVSRALSHLRQVSRRFEHRYSYRELLDLPFLRDFFLSNHQTRALGSGPELWPLWDDGMRALAKMTETFDDLVALPAVDPVSEATLAQAVANLDEVDVLGLQDEFDCWWEVCRAAFGWPEAPIGAINVGAEQETMPPPPVPDSILDELQQRNALDDRLYQMVRDRLSAAGQL